MANYGPLLHFNTAFNYYNWLPSDIMSWGPGKSNFWTRSTGPKPSQLVPKFIKCALETQNHRIEPNKPIIIFNAASIQHFQLVPNPFNSSKTQSPSTTDMSHHQDQ